MFTPRLAAACCAVLLLMSSEDAFWELFRMWLEVCYHHTSPPGEKVLLCGAAARVFLLFFLSQTFPPFFFAPVSFGTRSIVAAARGIRESV
uniref:Putative secreted protein n=1 Tax=Anopheles darlingi TaxID=43151 RepID=A0A2M4D1R9_ANODA